MSPPSLERLVPQSVSKEQWLHFWGTSELTRGNRIFEVIIVSFFGLWSTWFLSFAIGNTVGTFLAFIFIFWWLIAPYLAAARRNADFREGITRAANPFKSARLEFTALFTGEVAACERVAADVNGRRYMLRLSIRDESGRLLQVRAPDQPEPIAADIASVAIAELDVLAALLSRLDGFVAADSGPMHLAAAAGVPVVGLFKATAPASYAPLGPGCTALEASELAAERVLAAVAERACNTETRVA